MWYAKMYFSEKKEVFQFDSYGVQGVPSTCGSSRSWRACFLFWRWTVRSWSPCCGGLMRIGPF